MEFINVIDSNGKEWVLNKAYIVGMSPIFGGSNWDRGAQIHLDQQAYSSSNITINGDQVVAVQMALGVMIS